MEAAETFGDDSGEYELSGIGWRVRTTVDARRSLLDTTAGWVWSTKS